MKTIVVTGASGGIGEATARRLAADGNRVVLSGRRERELAEISLEIGERALFVVADVTKRDDIARLRDEALRVFGEIDVWINNAGRGISRQPLELTDRDFDEMMAVNVKSALYGMQAIAPRFIERGSGHIINISSFLGRVPLATHRSAYNAAKAALNAITANVRGELAPHRGIHVTLVMPGLVSTEFARNVLGEPASGPPPWIAKTGALPAGAMTPQTADEIAAVIAGVIDHPVAEIYTNPMSAGLVLRYLEDVAAFEQRLLE